MAVRQSATRLCTGSYACEYSFVLSAPKMCDQHFRPYKNRPISFLSYSGWKIIMGHTLEELKAARKTIVRIVQTRKDGAQYLPIVLALERTIKESKGLSDDLTRILEEVV